MRDTAIEQAAVMSSNIEDAISGALGSCLEQTELSCSYKTKNVVRHILLQLLALCNASPC